MGKKFSRYDDLENQDLIGGNQKKFGKEYSIMSPVINEEAETRNNTNFFVRAISLFYNEEHFVSREYNTIPNQKYLINSYQVSIFPTKIIISDRVNTCYKQSVERESVKGDGFHFHPDYGIKDGEIFIPKHDKEFGQEFVVKEFRRIFIGYMADTSSGLLSVGHAFLIYLGINTDENKHHYLYIHEGIFEFFSDEEILEFYSYLGELNKIPYCSALTKSELFFLTFKKKVKRKFFLYNGYNWAGRSYRELLNRIDLVPDDYGGYKASPLRAQIVENIEGKYV